MAEESEPKASSDPRTRRHRRLFLGSLAVGALLLIAACTPVKPPAGDTTPPAAPTIDLDTGSDGGPPHDDDITNDTTPTFVGMAEAGATVRLLDGLTDVGVGTADDAGTYSITSTELAPGLHEMRTLATDAAGNQSEPSALLEVEIDVTAPTAVPSTPDLISTHDSGVSATDNVTNENMPTFEGTGANGLSVRLYSGTQLVETAAVVAGDYSIITSPKEFDDGPHAMTVRHVDAAGNESPPSGTLNLTVDTTVPSVGLDEVADPSANPPTLTGPAGTAFGDLTTVTVEIYLGTTTDGDPKHTHTPSVSDSTWTQVAGPLDPSTVYTVRASQNDVAGNTGTSATDAFTTSA